MRPKGPEDQRGPGVFIVATGFSRQVETGRAVVIVEERRLSAVSPLDDMVGHSRDNNTCKMSHVGNLSEHPGSVKK